jgi:hypothetical protein
MCLTEEEREILDNADPEAVGQAFTDVFRENDGRKLRELLNASARRCYYSRALQQAHQESRSAT